MNHTVSESPPLRLHTRYNANKFIKLPLHPHETEIVATNCAVCGDRLNELITVRNRDGAPVLARGACFSCGFISFTRMPNNKWFQDFYRSDWDQERTAESIEHKIEAPYGPLLELLVPRIPGPGARILEIGSGYGGALNSLRREGFNNLRGIEASERRWRICRDRLGLNVALQPAETMATDPLIAEGAPYDVVFSWHVIEHLFDLNQALASASRLLKPGGYFVIGVPHVEQEHLIYLAHYLPHIHSFTPDNLTELLQKYGFVVEFVDAKIRAVFRKAADRPAPAIQKRPVMGPIEKIERDLDYSGLRASHAEPRTAMHLDYRMTMFAPCGATARNVGNSGIRSRTAYLLRRRGLGVGHNLKPMLHPRIRLENILDPANLLHWAARRCLKLTEYEFGAEVEHPPAGVPVSRVDLIYPGEVGFGWVK